MKKNLVLTGLAAGALAVSALVGTQSGASAMPSGTPSVHTVHVCTSHPGPAFATCLAVALADARGTIMSSASPLVGSFTPAMIQDAYNLTGLKSGGVTVAIVDAYGYSGLESDLTAYRSHFSLPACTTKNGCLQIMNEHGGSTLPPDNSGWDLEQALDVDAVSAVCPDCKIIMVQGKGASTHSLGIAENTAAKQPGVVAISNSYIGHDRKAISNYNHPGIAITAGTGDGGYVGGQYPADDPHVVAVSGTSLTADSSSRGWNEHAWSGTGSGCALYNKMPAWQKDAKTTCKTRAMGDVSAAADPGAGGLSIYFQGRFISVGGTSEATPIIAAVYALSGNTKGYPAEIPYENASHLYDITTGSNGSCGVPICTARKGWDGVTGVGTPNGVKGF